MSTLSHVHIYTSHLFQLDLCSCNKKGPEWCACLQAHTAIALCQFSLGGWLHQAEIPRLHGRSSLLRQTLHWGEAASTCIHNSFNNRVICSSSYMHHWFLMQVVCCYNCVFVPYALPVFGSLARHHCPCHLCCLVCTESTALRLKHWTLCHWHLALFLVIPEDIAVDWDNSGGNNQAQLMSLSYRQFWKIWIKQAKLQVRSCCKQPRMYIRTVPSTGEMSMSWLLLSATSAYVGVQPPYHKGNNCPLNIQ